MPKTKFICEHCGKEFERWASKYPNGIAKYCSLKCNGASQKNKETESRKLIKCDNCNKEFLMYDWQYAKSKKHFCSMKCSGDFKNKQLTLKCECCGKEFKAKKSRVENFNPRFCSWDCRSKVIISKRFYSTYFWRKKLRVQCHERDNYTCQKCGSKEQLHAHHIKPRSLNGEDTLDNLITLCNSCHQKTERKFKIKKK